MLINETDLPAKRVRQIVSFVQSRCEYGAIADVVLKPRVWGNVAWGYAHYENPREAERKLPSMVEVYIDSKPDLFPHKTEYRKSVGPVILTSWEEELALVLGHELRHIEQRWSFCPIQSKQPEVDAERFGQTMLNEWRRKNAGYGIIPPTSFREYTRIQREAAQT